MEVNSPVAFSEKDISISGKDFHIHGNIECQYFNTLPEVFSDHQPLFLILKRYGFRPHVILDVGANLGLFTLGGSVEFPFAKIYCYEPHPDAYSSLVENTKGMYGNIIANNFALGSSDGEMLFHPGGPINQKRSAGAHLMNDSHWRDTDFGINILVSTLDSQVKAHSINQIDLIKIDVEGFELDVLEGGAESIKKFSPLIYLEFNARALMALKNINPRNFLDYLGENFSFIHRCNRDATLTRLETNEDRIRFLHDNLIAHGCVDDLFVSNKDYLVS